ncbi:hypothetical protein [Brevibacillus sp. DP1.3A]|uniref:hypothetical protein n=1 Tax=Brevibacillus sp. DP1.3A TaxID=2738867 RepID=UPI00156BD80F|nr:hypothetical protein [Brevibacillus sp. DP1.3A]UED72184.1 hypothetical protein HP399_015555 [Brevibacillus sp. DP1.3A]
MNIGDEKPLLLGDELYLGKVHLRIEKTKRKYMGKNGCILGIMIKRGTKKPTFLQNFILQKNGQTYPVILIVRQTDFLLTQPQTSKVANSEQI